MAKSKETYNKKSREQKRRKQREDKQQKMEERKLNAGKGKSLDDMLAYVDENGNISDTPPDPRQKKVFKAEDIQIAIPPGNERDASRKGKLQYFNEEKGYGFIIDSIHGERVFVHSSNISTPLELNDKVRFDTMNSEKGMIAINVSKIGD
ncbi:MAG TPA: cold shock domain-containing protein [Chitinophagaceae bacterium]|nr:cold shock domain-containing protein [Chitinophagaceae bacterium]